VRHKRWSAKLALMLMLSVLTGVVGASAIGQEAAGRLTADVPMLAATARAAEPIIIDHTCTDLSQIPSYWIEQAKQYLRLSYGHTSHGSQPITGMAILKNNPAYGGLYAFNTDGAIQTGVLSLADGTPPDDLGHNGDTSWADRTRTYLDAQGSNRNVVIWSWCGGVSDNTEAGIDAYLNAMSQLEADYPDVTFVYMTGHLDGTGTAGNLNARNDQIRNYCIANNKVLYDFADIESYDPDGDGFLALHADDNCDYDGGNNWASQWCGAHPGDELCADCTCAHSQPLNCNLKARAFWWMLARIAGWPGPSGETGVMVQKDASSTTPAQTQVVTYTVVVRSQPAPLSGTAQLTDVVSAGLAYLPGSLAATSGICTDTAAPRLGWSGPLSPTPAVTLTYAVTVTAASPLAITNVVTVTAPGYAAISTMHTLIANGRSTYLPLVLRRFP